MKTSRLVVGFLVVWVIASCRNDDNIIPGIVVPPQTLAETEIENDAEITAFLQTHFYNYEEFATPPAGFDFKVKVDTIAGDNAGKISLMDRPELSMKTITVNSADVGRDSEEGESVVHTLYILKIRDGINEGPKIGDFAIVQYEGFLTSNTSFDGFSTPNRQYLPAFLRGYREAIATFKTGNGPFDNGDGTVSYEDYGIGMVFIPSGLGYFDDPRIPGIAAYSPLIFKFDVLGAELDTDFDEDGIPSFQEDLNGNGIFFDDNTDGDLQANHNDADDDGDGIPTIDEIKIDGEIKKDANGLIIFPDTDGDETPDHLDNDN